MTLSTHIFWGTVPFFRALSHQQKPFFFHVSNLTRVPSAYLHRHGIYTLLTYEWNIFIRVLLTCIVYSEYGMYLSDNPSFRWLFIHYRHFSIYLCYIERILVLNVSIYRWIHLTQKAKKSRIRNLVMIVVIGVAELVQRFSMWLKCISIDERGNSLFWCWLCKWIKYEQKISSRLTWIETILMAFQWVGNR